MADAEGQKGFLYEKKAHEALVKYNISTGSPGGAVHGRADLKITGPPAGVELKTTSTAAGSLVLKYFTGLWSYGSRKGYPEKEFIYQIGEKFNLMRELNHSGRHGRNWRGKTPHLQNDPKNPRVKIVVGARNLQDAYEKDIKQFGKQNEVVIPIPASYICEYYIKKNCSYLNVGTDGFYTLNGKDTLGLNPRLVKDKMSPLPDFSRSVRAIIRVRVHYKGGGAYQFSATFSFRVIRPSIYNIAPLLKGSKFEIDVRALAENPILRAFI